MVNLELHLGVIQNVNIKNRTIDIVDISKSNVTSVNYRDVYFGDIIEKQLIPQVGYTVLFVTLSVVAGTESIVMPIKYYSSVLNGDEENSFKSLFKDALQATGDQILATPGGTSLSLLEQAVIINAGSQTIKIDKNNSQTVINYDSLVINGADGLTITQPQDSNTLTILKGNTKITIDDNNINISTDKQIDLNANNINIGGESTVKGQSLLQWLNTHTHSNGNNGYPTGTPINQAQNTLLVKEQ